MVNSINVNSAQLTQQSHRLFYIEKIMLLGHYANATVIARNVGEAVS